MYSDCSQSSRLRSDLRKCVADCVLHFLSPGTSPICASIKSVIHASSMFARCCCNATRREHDKVSVTHYFSEARALCM